MRSDIRAGARKAGSKCAY